MTAITEYDGFFWPADDRSARQVILRDRDADVANMLKHTPGRQLIVQAGANVGVYPIALAKHFEVVVTCEPDPTNCECLAKNLNAHDPELRVRSVRAAFGAAEGVCSPVVVSEGNCGAHRVDYAAGEVPVITIDSLKLEACDGLWLDLEGSELFALQGAVETIKRFGPTIRIEDKGLDARFFNVPRGEVQTFLAGLGYSQVDAIGRDKVFRKAK